MPEKMITIKIPQDNDPMKTIHQVILNMLVTKYLDNKVFEQIYTWGETLSYIIWMIRCSYRRNILASPGQAVFGRDMIFNLALVIDWIVITT